MTEDETVSNFKDSLVASELANIDTESLSEEDAETVLLTVEYLRSQ